MINNNKSQQHESDLSSSISEYPKCGYNIHGIEGINPRFKCIFCFLIIREPIQLAECGHRSCRGCFEFRAALVPDGNITCPNDDCHEITNKNQIMFDKAFKKELDAMSIICVHQTDKQCSWTGLLKDYQLHLDDTHIHYNCSDCNERLPSKAALDDHLKICPAIFQSCPFASFCTDEMIRRTEFSNHLLSEKHQETLSKFLIGEYKFLETSNHDQQEDQLNKELKEKTSKQLDNLSKDIQKLNDEKIEIDNSFNQLHERLNTTVQELNNFHQTFNERISIKQILQPNQEKIQKDIEQLQDLYDNNQHISTDGTLTWRIEQISEKMADAQSERQTSIYSPIFYSSPTGYKMRARLFLFGDGNARRTHISLFFLLMKGDFDSILKWPFHFKVTFCLLDQTGNNRHIIDSFYPDVKSNSFQRPKELANTASGIPKFFPLPMLLQDDNAYVRENTLYIKIIIALNEAPKSILPFMLTLNPALPNYVQEHLINQETAKQQQQANAASSS